MSEDKGCIDNCKNGRRVTWDKGLACIYDQCNSSGCSIRLVLKLESVNT